MIAAGLAVAVLGFGAAGPDVVRSPETVEVVMAAAPEVAAELQASLRELLGRLAVTAHFERRPAIDAREVVTPREDAARPAPLAHLWIDFAQATRATVYIADRGWERILVRHVPMPNGPDEVAREEVAHIVEAAVDALLDGAQIGLQRESASAALGLPPPAPPPRPARVRDASLELGVHYAAQAWSQSETAAHGPVLSLAFSGPYGRGGARAGLWLLVQGRLPTVVDGAQVGVRLDHATLRALPFADLPIGARSVVRLAVGGGVDLTRFEPRRHVDADVTLDRPDFVAAPQASAALALHRRIFGRAELVVAAVVDIDLVGTRYVIERGGVTEDLFRPWRVRPGLSLGIATDLLGPAAR